MARFYHPGTGFTALIGFPEGHDSEAPAHPRHSALSSIRRGRATTGSSTRSARSIRWCAIRTSIARWILPRFAHGAFSSAGRRMRLGLGRPAWILEAFALQNVVAWLILALAADTLAAIAHRPGACALDRLSLFARSALVGPVRAARRPEPAAHALSPFSARKQGRTSSRPFVAGVNGLGRETNVLGGLAQPWPSSRRDWIRLLVALLLLVVPLLLWGTTCARSTARRSLPGETSSPCPDPPSSARSVAPCLRPCLVGRCSANGLQLCIVAAARRAGHLSWPCDVRPESPWWRVALGYVVLMLLIGRVLWDPTTGAITRVMLPVTVGFNVLLLRESLQPPLLVVVHCRQPAPRCLVAGHAALVGADVEGQSGGLRGNASVVGCQQQRSREMMMRVTIVTVLCLGVVYARMGAAQAPQAPTMVGGREAGSTASCPEMATALGALMRNDVRASRLGEHGALPRGQPQRCSRRPSGESRVVFMGDSITDGWQQPRYGGFFPGKPYVDRGISGQTTPQMLLRFRPRRDRSASRRPS